MNSEFVKKIIAAKRLECEALRELLPEKLKSDIEEIGMCLMDALMDDIKKYCISHWDKDKYTPSEGKGESMTSESKVRKVTVE